MWVAVLLAATVAATTSATTILDKIAHPVAHAIDMDNDGDTDVLTVSTRGSLYKKALPARLTHPPGRSMLPVSSCTSRTQPATAPLGRRAQSRRREIQVATPKPQHRRSRRCSS